MYWSMESVIQKINQKFMKPQVVDVQSGDTVKVHQKIREGNKERVQIFQGLVIRVDRKASHTSRIVVRKIASGVEVEKAEAEAKAQVAAEAEAKAAEKANEQAELDAKAEAALKAHEETK